MIKFVSDFLGRWFSSGPPVSSTDKSDGHDTPSNKQFTPFSSYKASRAIHHNGRLKCPAHNQSINGKDKTIKALLFQEGLCLFKDGPNAY